MGCHPRRFSRLLGPAWAAWLLLTRGGVRDLCSMYRMLLQFHERYKHLKIRYIIAENGIADETDVIRRPYMIEHLLAIKAAIHDVSHPVRPPHTSRPCSTLLHARGCLVTMPARSIDPWPDILVYFSSHLVSPLLRSVVAVLCSALPPHPQERDCPFRACLVQGVPIDGYFHWTLSDNWEWADGYGPKFGLVAVDRENDLKRTPRPSYHLYSQVSHRASRTHRHSDAQWPRAATVWAVRISCLAGRQCHCARLDVMLTGGRRCGCRLPRRVRSRRACASRRGTSCCRRRRKARRASSVARSTAGGSCTQVSTEALSRQLLGSGGVQMILDGRAEGVVERLPRGSTPFDLHNLLFIRMGNTCARPAVAVGGSQGTASNVMVLNTHTRCSRPPSARLPKPRLLPAFSIPCVTPCVASYIPLR